MSVTVTFVDQSQGNPLPTSWLWDFGDGETSTEQNPTHEYAEENYYTVTLTASNVYGSDTKSMTVEAFCPDEPWGSGSGSGEVY